MKNKTKEIKQILMIMHATSWSDKLERAKISLNDLVHSCQFEKIIEFLPNNEEIIQKRYVSHNGDLFIHDEISPVPYLNKYFDQIMSDLDLADGDPILLAGGVRNGTGGCLDYLYRYVERYIDENNLHIKVSVVTEATY